MTFLNRRDHDAPWGIYAKFRDDTVAQLTYKGQTSWPLRKARAIQRDLALFILHDPSCPIRYTTIIKEEK